MKIGGGWSLALLALMAVTACGGYRSNPDCPLSEGGKCQSAMKSYGELVGGRDEKKIGGEGKKGRQPGKTVPVGKGKPENVVSEGAPGEPPLKPLMTPGKMARMWVNHYQPDGGTVVTEHYVLFRVSNPEFLLGRRIGKGGDR